MRDQRRLRHPRLHHHRRPPWLAIRRPTRRPPPLPAISLLSRVGPARVAKPRRCSFWGSAVWCCSARCLSSCRSASSRRSSRWCSPRGQSARSTSPDGALTGLGAIKAGVICSWVAIGISVAWFALVIALIALGTATESHHREHVGRHVRKRGRAGGSGGGDATIGAGAQTAVTGFAANQQGDLNVHRAR